jgi:hypothetical protein
VSQALGMRTLPGQLIRSDRWARSHDGESTVGSVTVRRGRRSIAESACRRGIVFSGQATRMTLLPSCRSGSRRSTRLRPRFFARYKAWSAFSRAALKLAVSFAAATPALTVE